MDASRRRKSHGLAGFLAALLGLLISAGIGWAGLALWSPSMAGVTLPPLVAALPFEQRWWGVALMLLGAAGVAAAFPPPFWTDAPRRLKAFDPAAPGLVLGSEVRAPIAAGPVEVAAEQALGPEVEAPELDEPELFPQAPAVGSPDSL